MDPATPLSTIIGEQLRRLRERRQLRQEDVAAEVQRYGLNWRRATVAAVEAGDREVSLADIVLLSLTFQKRLDWWLVGDDGALGHSDALIQLTPTAAGPAKGVVAILSGYGAMDFKVATNPRLKRGLGLDVTQWRVQAAAELRNLNDRFEAEREKAENLWPEIGDDELLAAQLAARQDAEMKAARRLKVTPIEVGVLAVRIWGHGLTTERDRRVEAAGTGEGESPRRLQARRGHVGRALLLELEVALSESGES